jgi:GAF domain-containing protein
MLPPRGGDVWSRAGGGARAAGPRPSPPPGGAISPPPVDQCAQAIHRARLFEEQSSAAQRQRTLTRAAQRLVRALTVGEAAQELAQVIVPDLGETAIVHVADGGALRIAAWAHADEDMAAVLRARAQRVRYTRNPLLIQAARSGEPLILTDIAHDQLDEQAGDSEISSLLSLLAVTSLVVVPLQARGRTVGTLTVTRSGQERSLRDDDVPFLRELGAFASVVIDNAVLFEDRSRIAHTLQMTLLPPSLPTIPGIDLGATYRAAGAGLEVGGDFYDVFRADRDRWVVVIGDARGRGADAAATAGLARHIVRATGFGDASPSEIVEQLNRVLLDWHRERPVEVEPRFCALNVIVLDTATWHVAVCCAGNPLPLLVRGERVVEIGTPGTVAGVTENTDATTVEALLEPGDLLVTFTDGISERRVGDKLFEDVLPDVLATLARQPAAAVAARLCEAAEDFAEQLPGDDMAVVALLRRP